MSYNNTIVKGFFVLLNMIATDQNSSVKYKLKKE